MSSNNNGNNLKGSVQNTPIYKTRDFDQFSFRDYNRNVSEKAVSDLIQSIKEKNYLEFEPITVRPDGTVIEGQDRMEAARRLDISIYYIINDDPQYEPKDVSLLQEGAGDWGTTDHLVLWKELSNQIYLKFDSILLKNPGMTFSQIFNIVRGGVKEEGDQQFRGKLESGGFSLDATEEAEFDRLIEEYTEILGVSNYGGSSGFSKAWLAVRKDPDFSHDQLVHKLNLGNEFEEKPRIMDHKAQIIKTHNKNLGKTENEVTPHNHIDIYDVM